MFSDPLELPDGMAETMEAHDAQGMTRGELALVFDFMPSDRVVADGAGEPDTGARPQSSFGVARNLAAAESLARLEPECPLVFGIQSPCSIDLGRVGGNARC